MPVDLSEQKTKSLSKRTKGLCWGWWNLDQAWTPLGFPRYTEHKKYKDTRRKYSTTAAEVAPKWLDKRLFPPISLLLLCTLQFSSEDMYYLMTKNQNPEMSQTPKLQCGIFLVYPGLPHPPGYKAIFSSNNCYFNPGCWGQSSVFKKEIYACSQKDRLTNSGNEWMKG